MKTPLIALWVLVALGARRAVIQFVGPHVVGGAAPPSRSSASFTGNLPVGGVRSAFSTNPMPSAPIPRGGGFFVLQNILKTHTPMINI